jgi:hypothetical protein
MLEMLVRNEGKLVSQRQLLQEVWGPEYSTETEYLRTFMASLRRKLEPQPSAPAYLLTEQGMGYRFVRHDGGDPLRRRVGDAERTALAAYQGRVEIPESRVKKV